MLSAYKKSTLFLIPGVLLGMREIIPFFSRYIRYKAGNESLEEGATLTVFFWVFSFLFLSWEFIINKQWKQVGLAAAGVVGYYFLSKYAWLLFDFKNNKDALEMHYIYSMAFSPFIWFALIIGLLRGGIKQGLMGLAFGVSFSAFYSLRVSFFTVAYDNILGIETWLFVIFSCLPGYAYFYLLEFFANPENLQFSMSEQAKKQPVSKSGFFIPFVILYLLLVTRFAGFNSAMHERYLPWGKPFLISWQLVLTIVVSSLTWLLIIHSLSNLLIRKLYEIKRPIGWRYLFSFFPVINIFVIGGLFWNRAKHSRHAEEIITGTRYKYYEDDAAGNYKAGIILMSILGYVYTLGILGNSPVEGDVIFNGLFYALNIAILFAFYTHKNAWILLLLNLVALTICRFVLGLSGQGPAMVSFISGILLVYIYVQSFHPISLDLTPKPEIVEESE